MYTNRMTVPVTIKCGECARCATSYAELEVAAMSLATPPPPGGSRLQYSLRAGSIGPPADWKSIMIGGGAYELFCPLCAKEALHDISWHGR